MIRYRTLFEDLTGLREGSGQPGRDRVAEIRGSDQNVAGNGGRLAGTSDRMAANGDRIGDNSDLAVENRGLASENIDRTADRPL